MSNEPARQPETAISPASSGQSIAKVTFTRGDLWLSAAVGMVAFVAYALTLAEGLLRADMGEFQTLAATLGHAHPTGYPVYLLLAKASTAIPFGDIAYRVNLLSALMGAVAVALMVPLGKVLTGRRWVSAVGALALAFSPAFWSQAIIAEVYTTGAVCMLGILLALAIWQVNGRLRWLFVAGCLGGMVLGVHTTVAFMAFGAVVFVWLKPERRAVHAAVATLGAVAGVAVFLIAFAIVDRADSPCGYFHTVLEPSRSEWNLAPEDTDGFFERVRLSLSAPQFQGMLFSQTPSQTSAKTIEYLENLSREFPPLWLVAAALGCWHLNRRNGRMMLLLGLTWFAHLFYELQFNGIVWVMYISTYVLVALLGVVGLDWCISEIGKRVARSPIALDRAVGAVGVFVVAWPMFFASAWDDEGRRAYWVPEEERDSVGVAYSAQFHDDVEWFIDGLEDDAVVFTGWCVLYPYYYVAHVEKGRTDMVFLHDYPSAGRFVLADSAIDYIREIKRTTPDRAIYVTGEPPNVAAAFELEAAHEDPDRNLVYRVGSPKP